MSDKKASFLDSLPVIVGVGQFKEQNAPLSEARNPIQLMEEAASKAASDAGISLVELSKIDHLIVVRGANDRMKNPVDALAQLLSTQAAKQYLSPTGGNMPQMLVNHCAEKIVGGKMEMVLLAGAEALDTWAKAKKAEIQLDWNIPTDHPPAELFPEKPGTTDLENHYGLAFPANTYPMFENALRHHYGRDLATHQKKISELFSRFTEIAAANPNAWFPIKRTAEEIATPSPQNRYVGFPYTKYLNAIMRVNMSAAVIMCSAGKARSLGIPEEKWVYLHGCGDANDHWHVTERVNYYSSPAIKAVSDTAFEMAETQVDDIDFFDLYSCFPSAVQIGRDMIGIREDDPRDLTITGGLPYFGGPGNNYVMHSIASMVEKLRANPGKKGMVTGNGWYVTKHSAGIYSTTPNHKPWQRKNPPQIQAIVDKDPKPNFIADYEGPGQVETYTILFDRSGEPTQGIIIGRTQNSDRFLAFMERDKSLLNELTQKELIGLPGSVNKEKFGHLFKFK